MILIQHHPTEMLSGNNMKKLMILMLFTSITYGCAIATITVDNPDGTKCHATYMSAFKGLSDVRMTACNAAGEAGNSTTDPILASVIDTVIKTAITSTIPKVPVTTQSTGTMR